MTVPTKHNKPGEVKGKPLAIVKRTRPTPPVGHYEATSSLTHPRTRSVIPLSKDKQPKVSFKPKLLNPEPDTTDLEKYLTRIDQ